MSEIARVEPITRTVVRQHDRDTVDGWVETLPIIVELAQRISATDFVKPSLRGNVAAVAAAMLMGRELGIGPMQSLQAIDVIDGRPAVSAEMARGFALAAGHDLYIEETTTTRCVARGRRRGATEWVTITWTIDDAKRAKLDGRQNWRNHPRRMLQARATSELCHLLFADAVGGMPFTIEEAIDDTDAEGRISTEAAPRAKTAQRKTRVVNAAPEPELPDDEPKAGHPPTVQAVIDDEPELPDPGLPDEEPPSEPVEGGGGITKKQRGRIHATFNDKGISERDERQHITSVLVGRFVESSNDLSFAEASTLIDTMASAADRGALLALVDQIEEAKP